jgi:hypothetical protein
MKRLDQLFIHNIGNWFWVSPLSINPVFGNFQNSGTCQSFTATEISKIKVCINYCKEVKILLMKLEENVNKYKINGRSVA